MLYFNTLALCWLYEMCKQNARLTMEFHQKIENMELKKMYIPVETGKQNALDFQLVTYLGACIQKHPKKKYYIVSKDHGYNCVCHFWSNKGVFVKRINHIYEYYG